MYSMYNKWIGLTFFLHPFCQTHLFDLFDSIQTMNVNNTVHTIHVVVVSVQIILTQQSNDQILATLFNLLRLN